MAAVQYAGRRAVLTIAWGPRRRDRSLVEPAAVEPPAASRPQVSAPATVTAMPRPDGRLTTTERASTAGKASAEALTPDERKERARKAVSVSNSPAARARSIVRAWPELDDDERAEVRAILRRGGVFTR